MSRFFDSCCRLFLLVRGVRRWLFNRSGCRRIIFYPTTVRAASRQVIPTREVNLLGPAAQLIDAVFPVTIKIAGGFFTINSRKDFQDFDADHEVLLSLHRWHWLLDDSGESISYQRGCSLILTWIEVLGASAPRDILESYSESERIANFVLFHLAHRGEAPLPENIANFLLVRCERLVNHLEYHPDGLTGNHALNNGRALVIFGLITGDTRLFNVGKSIFLDLVPVLFIDGLLREGSSHYHFLVSRWLMEAYYFCLIFSERELAGFLHSVIRETREAGNMLVVEKAMRPTYPLIGDISPDCSTLWLDGLTKRSVVGAENYPCSSWVSKFSFIKEVIDRELYERYPDAPRYPRAKTELRGGVLRVDYKSWVLFIRVEPTLPSAIASHAHTDSLGLIAYFDGESVLSDVGRTNYDDKARSEEQCSAKSHSVPLLEGRAASIASGSKFELRGRAFTNVTIEAEESEDDFTVTIWHNGFFTREPVDALSFRKLCVLEDELIITDCFLLGSSRSHLSETFIVSSTSWDIALDACPLALRRNVDSVPFSLDYGVVEGSYRRIRYEGYIDSNTPITFRVHRH